MGMRDCPTQSTIFEQNIIRGAWKIRSHTTCYLQVVASGYCRAGLTARQSPPTYTRKSQGRAGVQDHSDSGILMNDLVWKIYYVLFANKILWLNAVRVIIK